MFWYVLLAFIIGHEQRMLHIVLSFVWLYHTLQHYLINGTILGKMLLIIKCVS
jgi:predicted glycosyltransferase